VTVRSQDLRSAAARWAGAAARRARRSSVAGALARRLPARAAVLGGRGPTPPALTVVLPVYDVEDYLAECLDSVLGQSLTDLEVVAVDDGSTDGSAAVLAEYAARDPRLRVVRQANAGLGAARNTGVRQARGTWLTFVDSDDRLPAGALEALVGSLRRTGSDLAVGAVVRFDSSRRWTPEWVHELHARDRLRTTLEELPGLLRNNYTWNKVYSRELWERSGLEFREGVAYEDQPIVTQLLLRARSLDVLSATVYEYRAREDRSSISQQTDSMPDLRDRVLAWQTSRDVLLREASEPVYAAWLQTLFSTHFHWYLDNDSVEDVEYWKFLSEAVRDLAQDASEQVWRRTPPTRRVAVELARRGLHDELVELRRRGGKRAESWPVRVRPDGLVLELPGQGPDGPGLDDDLFLLPVEQLAVRSALHRVTWLPDATGPGADRVLQVDGYAYLPHLDLREHPTDIALALRDRATGEVLPLRVQRVDDPALRPPGTSEHADHGASTFTAQVDLRDLVAAGRRAWVLEASVTTAGFTVTGPVTDLGRTGSAAVLESALSPDGWWVHLSSPARRPLQVRVVPPRATVVEARLEGRQVIARVRPPAGRPYAAVQLEADRAGARGTAGPLQPDGTQELVVAVPPAPPTDVPGAAAHRWAVRGVLPSGALEPLALPGGPELADACVVGGAVLGLERTRRGNLGVVGWPGLVRVGAARLSDGALHLEGTVLGGPADLSLRLRGVVARTADVTVDRDGDRFTARLPLIAGRGRFGDLPLPTRTYVVEAGGDAADEVVVVPARALVRTLPRAVATDRLEGRLTRSGRDRLELALLTPRGEQARSRAAQHDLQQWSATLLPERSEGLLVRSYFGETATDNGLGVVAELRRRGADLPVRWVVKDHSVPLPEGVDPVVHGSRDWYRLLGTSRYYLDNMFQPRTHAKPPGQVMVQTFHGYPFKSMGHTYWARAGFARDLVESYDARAREWDHLVSPARYATPLLRREFHYDGDVLEIGYPRNDVLQSPQAPALRARVRAALGIGDRQTAVLYAPTFRDDLAQDNHRATHQDLLGLEALAAELGPEFVVLHRGHAFHARTGTRTGSRDNLVDVTDYPEVSDLYLAADAAVVDYSSLRFDFGVTGKPMIFFVPDLERYQQMRGWLVDYVPTAPGPRLSERAEVVRELRDLDGLRRRHADAYRRFREEYLSLEDGHAGARLVDAVFVPRGDAPPADG